MNVLHGINKIVAIRCFLTRREALAWTRQADELLANQGLLTRRSNLNQALKARGWTAGNIYDHGTGRVNMLGAATEICIPSCPLADGGLEAASRQPDSYTNRNT